MIDSFFDKMCLNGQNKIQVLVNCLCLVLAVMSVSPGLVDLSRLYQTEFVRSARAVGVLWAVCTLCFAIIHVVILVQPSWITTADTRTSKLVPPLPSGTMGLFEVRHPSSNPNCSFRASLAFSSCFISSEVHFWYLRPSKQILESCWSPYFCLFQGVYGVGLAGPGLSGCFVQPVSAAVLPVSGSVGGGVPVGRVDQRPLPLSLQVLQRCNCLQDLCLAAADSRSVGCSDGPTFHRGRLCFCTSCLCSSAGFCLALACLLFPDSWESPEMRALCGDSVRRFDLLFPVNSVDKCVADWLLYHKLDGILVLYIIPILCETLQP